MKTVSIKGSKVKTVLVVSLLVVSVLAIGVSFVGCGKEVPVQQPPETVTIVQETETTVPETIEESLADSGIEVEEIDINLDTSMAGSYFIVKEDQTMYKECNRDSESMGLINIDTEINVSGMYGDTGMFQVVDDFGVIMGYVDSEFCDTVRGGLIVDGTDGENTSGVGITNDSKPLTEEETGLTQEELDKIISGGLPTGGIMNNWTPPAGTTNSDHSGENFDGGDVQLGDGSGGENISVD